MKTNLYLLFFIIFFFSHSAFACDIKREGSFAQQVKQEPLVFIGRVVSVDENAVVFAVIKTIKGINGSQYILIKSKCNLNFVKNDVWFYAGNFISSPSMKIEEDSDIIELLSILFSYP